MAILLIFSGPVVAEDDTSIAVMELTAKGGVTQEQVDALGDMLINEVRSLCQCNVIGKSDIVAALKLEEQKVMLGCSDDSCLAEIGGALGVPWLCVGNVSQFGKSFLLNLRMMDVAKVKLAGSVSVKVRGSHEQLVNALPQASRELLAQAKNKIWPEGNGPDLTAATGLKVAGEEPFDYSTWGHVSFWSGAGLMALGGIGTGMMLSARKDYKGGKWSAEGDLESWTGVMFAGYGVGLALMITGTTLWLLDPRQNSPALNAVKTTGVSAALTPVDKGWSFSIGGRF